MNISDVSDLSGLPAKTIRYYEDIGLVRPARGANGYRRFNETDVHKLAFLARASADVKRVAEEHLDSVDRKIRVLKAMRATLSDLVAKCHGDRRPECPILDDLAGAGENRVQ